MRGAAECASRGRTARQLGRPLAASPLSPHRVAVVDVLQGSASPAGFCPPDPGVLCRAERHPTGQVTLLLPRWQCQWARCGHGSPPLCSQAGRGTALVPWLTPLGYGWALRAARGASCPHMVPRRMTLVRGHQRAKRCLWGSAGAGGLCTAHTWVPTAAPLEGSWGALGAAQLWGAGGECT